MSEAIAVSDLADELVRVSTLVDSASTILPLEQSRTAASVAAADATSKYLVLTANGARMFLIVSGHGNPDLVARGTRNIAAIREHLRPETAAPIVPPVETGLVMGRSFALWPVLDSLPNGRLAGRFARRALRPRVMAWLADLCHETRSPASAEGCARALASLNRVHDDPNHPEAARRAAQTAAERIASGQWDPMTCAQHSDLWLGNIMRGAAGTKRSFAVIDWAGATVSGYPFFDFCRFSISARAPARLVQTSMQGIVERMDCAPEDMPGYVLCALGQMQADLEFFPEHLFRRMFAETTEFALACAHDLA